MGPFEQLRDFPEYRDLVVPLPTPADVRSGDTGVSKSRPGVKRGAAPPPPQTPAAPSGPAAGPMINMGSSKSKEPDQGIDGDWVARMRGSLEQIREHLRVGATGWIDLVGAEVPFDRVPEPIFVCVRRAE